MTSQVDYLDWIGRLDSVVSEVFETMLARSCAPTDKADVMAQPIEAKILFSGAIDGEFLLFVDRPLARATAELLLGPIPDPHDPMVDDAAKELCNMIAGGWKSKLGSKEAACAISPPTISSPQKVEFNSISAAGFHRFYSVEGSIFGVQMVL
jgi:chemotaxis protein CheX